MRSLALLAVLVVGCATTPSAPPPTAPPAPAAETDPAPPTDRLPGDVKPSRYGLEFTIVPPQSTASGIVRIALEVVKPTRVVWLHARGLKTGKATINQKPARVIASNDTFVGVVAPDTLQPGAAQLTLEFTADIDPQKSRGLYSEKEGDDTYVYTFFEPIDARRAFPSFDEPSYKVPWQLTFHVKKDHGAYGNATVTKVTDEPNEMKRIELAETRPLPSYLVAFMVGPFEVVDAGAGGRVNTPIRFIIPKGRAGELRWAKDVTPRVVAALESYFDMDYPYGKLDVAVVPRYWGTMEHPGIVAMGQPLTLIKPEQETRSRKQRYANILAHELAHYWFGDLVTMAWWDDTWLNEALGSWADSIITDAVEPTWRYKDKRIWWSLEAMSSDETLSTQRIRLEVKSEQDIAASFDNTITYAKGASVLRMFEAATGEAKWQAFIRAYVRAFADKNASADDLLTAMKGHLGAKTEAQFRTFIEQPGLPLVTVELECKGKEATVSLRQQRALPFGVTDPENKVWKLPVCVRSGDTASLTTCIPLEEETATMTLPSCPKWLLPNANATGYYRSKLDPALVKQMFTPSSKVAQGAKPTGAERAMLVLDLQAMAARNELQVDALLELAPLVLADKDERVATFAQRAADFRDDVLDERLYQKAKNYRRKVFGASARTLGWTRAANDSDDKHDLRREVVPLIARDEPQLRAKAEALADGWLKTRKGLDDDLVDQALAVAAAHGGAARFDAILAAAKATTDRTEKRRLLAALGSFQDPALAARALEVVRNTEFDLRDSLAIVETSFLTRETRALASAFLQQRLDELLARMREDEASWFLTLLSQVSCTAELRGQMQALVMPRAEKFAGAKAPVTRGFEQSQQCIDQLGRQLPALTKFLEKY